MEILGYLAAVLIGISLGMIGSGGSILTVPVLVYLMGVDPFLATASSLFIVGTTSLAGGIRAYAKGQVDFKTITEFGIPSIFSIFITRHYLLPIIPDHFVVGGHTVSKSVLLMLVFAILMITASVSMIMSKDHDDRSRIRRKRRGKALQLMLMGIVIGVITGLLGAGGGFLIIPFLVLYLKLPMKRAIGTSLLIIAINSLFGFLFSLKQFHYNWNTLIIFTLLAIGGLFAGSKLAEKITSSSLKKSFGWFVLLIAIYIVSKELFFAGNW